MKVAVIGVGHLGKNHAKFLSKMPGVRLIGVVDINKDAANEIAHLYQTKPYYDYKEISKMVDAVTIATPTSSHYETAREMIERGIHTFIEKPITTTVSRADKLVRLAKKSRPGGIVLQVGHIERFNPAFVSAQEYIKEPRFIECHRLSSFSFRSVDIDVVLDLMIHDIDIILSLVKSPVKRIDAVGIKVISDKIDLANARISFRNGCVANLTASRASDKAMRKMRVFTDKNYASIDFADKTASVYERIGSLSLPVLMVPPSCPSPSRDGGYQQDPVRGIRTDPVLTGSRRDRDKGSLQERTLSGLIQHPAGIVNPKEFMLDKFIRLNNLQVEPYDQLEKELSSFVSAIREKRRPIVTGEDARNALMVCHKILNKLN
ncbi:MAG: Gfo/Idh/MocA family oxidoreductase [Planctomycetota bacterium]|nr:Gfo/Idh/MocA family oxidoreductase [Planctomycetota bacterium]MDI6788273.1 Gfo/Idh/MocA family oxidoreductase [Planctomycetota bacterium]